GDPPGPDRHGAATVRLGRQAGERRGDGAGRDAERGGHGLPARAGRGARRRGRGPAPGRGGAGGNQLPPPRRRGPRARGLAAAAQGDGLAPGALLLDPYARTPAGKHQCLELCAQRGVELPDTPVMALYRGRIDLLDEHLRRDPGLLTRTFTHREIYPSELGCHADESLALHGTPVAGTTLLHLCVEFLELEVARWLIERGGGVHARAGGGCRRVRRTYSAVRLRRGGGGLPQPGRHRPAAAGPRGGPERPRVAPKAAAVRGRRDDARVPRRHAPGLGRAVPRQEVREQGRPAAHRRPRWALNTSRQMEK